MKGQDVVRAKDLMLVFWNQRSLLTTESSARFIGDVRQRAVFGLEWEKPLYPDGGRLFMAAVVPMPSDEEAFKNAKEIK